VASEGLPFLIFELGQIFTPPPLLTGGVPHPSGHCSQGSGEGVKGISVGRPSGATYPLGVWEPSFFSPKAQRCEALADVPRSPKVSRARRMSAAHRGCSTPVQTLLKGERRGCQGNQRWAAAGGNIPARSVSIHILLLAEGTVLRSLGGRAPIAEGLPTEAHIRCSQGVPHPRPDNAQGREAGASSESVLGGRRG
jgi:hypothetical protein